MIVCINTLTLSSFIYFFFFPPSNSMFNVSMLHVNEGKERLLIFFFFFFSFHVLACFFSLCCCCCVGVVLVVGGASQGPAFVVWRNGPQPGSHYRVKWTKGVRRRQHQHQRRSAAAAAFSSVGSFNDSQQASLGSMASSITSRCCYSLPSFLFFSSLLFSSPSSSSSQPYKSITLLIAPNRISTSPNCLSSSSSSSSE